jgi:hypothetical protein
MNTIRPGQAYDAFNEQRFRDETKRELDRRLVVGRDIEVGQGRVILISPNGTRYALTVSNAGVLSAVAV